MGNPQAVDRENLLKPSEVAELFKVDAKTVTRWAQRGLISSITTPGGHKRYSEREIRAYLAGATRPALERPEGGPK